MKRRALFVGVNKYEDPQIRNLNFSLTDAHSLKAVFELSGYETDILEDPTKSDVFQAVQGMTEGLAAGDLFFFYFAGHGWTTTSGRHLLFCSDDQYEDLRYDDAGISFDKLKRKTAGAFNRAFVLDACRSDFLTGTRGEDTTTRDLRPITELVKGASANGTFAVLRSCSQYEHALEIESRRHGLFTLALLDVLQDSNKSGSELLFNESLCDSVTEKMRAIAKTVDVTAEQNPEFAKSGLPPVLVPGRAPDKSRAADSGANGRPGWLTAFTKWLPDVEVFPHVKLGEGFVPYGAVSDTGCLLIWPASWRCGGGAEGIAQSLEAARTDLRRTHPGVSPELIFLLDEGGAEAAEFLRRRGIRCLDETQFAAFAITFFSKAAEQVRAGKLAFENGDYETAFSLLNTADPPTDARVCSMLGYLYAHGKGVPRERAAAEAWYWKAALLGDEAAKETLKKNLDGEETRLREEEDAIVAEIEAFAQKLLSEDGDGGTPAAAVVREGAHGGEKSVENGSKASRAGGATPAKGGFQASGEIPGSCSDNLVVAPGQRLEIKGSCSGNVRIGENASLVCRGSCSGTVELDEGGSFTCFGSMSGNILNRGGTVAVYGSFSGTRTDF